MWRGWLLDDLKKAGFEPPNRHGFYNKFHELGDDEFAMARYLIEKNVPTYYARQYEGDAVVSTCHGSHDVMYVGGPSYQVAWNYGFSINGARRILEEMEGLQINKEHYGNDSSTTPLVLHRFLHKFEPLRSTFSRLFPKQYKMAETVS